MGTGSRRTGLPEERREILVATPPIANKSLVLAAGPEIITRVVYKNKALWLES
jgi:hypothetical protein